MSELIARIKPDNRARRMPLDGDRLAEAQIKLLDEWISAGTKYGRRSVYEHPERPQRPPVSDAGGARTN